MTLTNREKFCIGGAFIFLDYRFSKISEDTSIDWTKKLMKLYKISEDEVKEISLIFEEIKADVESAE